MESVFETLIDLNNITRLSVSEDFILNVVASRLQFIVILKSPPFICILSQMNPVQISQLYYFMTRFNINLLSMSKSSKWSLSFTFIHQNTLCNFSLPHVRHINCVFDLPRSLVSLSLCVTNHSIFSFEPSPLQQNLFSEIKVGLLV